MKRKITIGVVSILSLLIVSFGFIFANKKQTKNYKSEITIQASFPKNYKTIEDLYNDADIVIEGTADKMLSSYQGKIAVYTDTLLNVEKVYKGKTNDSSIIVYQGGGIVDNVKYTISGVETLKPKKKYILFLKNGFDGKYFMLGEWQSQFELESDFARNPERSRSLSKKEIIEKINKLQ